MTDFPCCVTCSIAIALFFPLFSFWIIAVCLDIKNKNQYLFCRGGGWEVKSVFFFKKKYLKNNKVDAVTCDINKIFIYFKYFMNSVIFPFFYNCANLFFLKNLGNNLMMPAMILCGAALSGTTFPFWFFNWITVK